MVAQQFAHRHRGRRSFLQHAGEGGGFGDGKRGAIHVIALEEAAFNVSRIAIEPGEKSKTLETLGDVFAQMAAFGMTRGDLVITFGGGVPGDLGGFAAATFLRGIRLAKAPRTEGPTHDETDSDD